MSYPRANIVIRGKPMTQNTPTPHNTLTLHPQPPPLRQPEFELVALNDPTGTLDDSSGRRDCRNLASHQLVNPQEVLAEMPAGKQLINCCMWCGWAFLNCYPDNWHAVRLRHPEPQPDHEPASPTTKEAYQ